MISASVSNHDTWILVYAYAPISKGCNTFTSTWILHRYLSDTLTAYPSLIVPLFHTVLVAILTFNINMPKRTVGSHKFINLEI